MCLRVCVCVSVCLCVYVCLYVWVGGCILRGQLSVGEVDKVAHTEHLIIHLVEDSAPGCVRVRARAREGECVCDSVRGCVCAVCVHAYRCGCVPWDAVSAGEVDKVANG